GAGGLGRAWTRHVVTHCQAQVIWIGRRAPDADIAAGIEEIARLGPAPFYVQADAADPAALQAALAQVHARWRVLHGVVVATVGAFDRGIAQTDEAQLREVLAAKVDTGRNFARLLQATPPQDFLLFFSSIVALEKNGGHAGYAAGGAFQDALALQLARSLPCRVQVVDWGHWDIGTGATIPEAAKLRRAQRGDVLLQPASAFALLENLLSSPWPQAAVLGTSRPQALDFVDAGQHWSIDLDARPSSLPNVATSEAAPALQAASVFNNATLEAELRPLLRAILQSQGLLSPDAAQRVAPGARGWLEASLALWTEGPAPPLTDAWSRWEAAKATSLANPDLQAAVSLADACLRALPRVLRGELPATDVLFPGGSMQRVEGIYRGNAVADHFNARLADAAFGALAQRLQHEPAARLRILEIGAGTGGTTALVLPRLAALADHIAEYAYTDVSKAFLFHAEEQFVPSHPFVQPRRFDVEQPPRQQGIALHGYDLVLATNVLHATRDIRRTLSHAKAALRGGGVLLLNEISTPSLFAHVTFGLLDGWWLAQDAGLRMPGSPGLSPARWAEVLRQEGFPQVEFPCAAAHGLGQQLVMARSDGVILQPANVAAAPAVERVVTAPQPAPAALPAACRERLGAVVARVLRMPAEAVEADVPLGDYGMDSILLVQLAEALREHLPRVSRTLLFEARTVDALAERLLAEQRDEVERWLGAAAASATRSHAAQPQPAVTIPAPAALADEPIAIIGMSCRFGPADDADAYWDLLCSGRSAIGEIPPERWPLEGFYHPDPDEAVRLGRSYGKWGAFLRDVHAFDPLFFHILPRDAATIDPQERLFLQAAWHALEDAGYTRERVRRDGGQLGVFAGITRTGFDLFGPALWQQGHTAYPHTSFSSAANRVSFFLDAHGPSLPVDTMCSSSLAAIHQACQSLRAGECRVAIAGGVNVFLHPSSYVGLSAARMLSPDGACRSFGDGANGFVPGEGVAALLLKPLSQAIADGDPIHALIRATHINHGGRTHGYTVPNPQAQTELVAQALRKAGVDAREVSYLEAHGTGTALGDPIEIAALTRAFRAHTRDEGFCAIGSAKSQVGHCEAAAGMAGVVKLVLQMRHRQFAPTLHAARRNPEIDFARTPFVLQDDAAPWPRPRQLRNGVERELPRIAGVSSFGAGGTNAHVLLQEYEAPARAARSAAPVPIVLSARNADRLRATARRLAAFLARDDAPALADIAYTLQVGREAMEERIAFVAESIAQLLEQLRSWIDGRGDVHQANVRQHREATTARKADAATAQAVAAAFAAGRHDDYLGWWTQGLEIDWEQLHAVASSPARRVHLPGYAFDTTAYTLPQPVTTSAPVAATSGSLAAAAQVDSAGSAALTRPQFSLAPLAAFASAPDAAPVAAFAFEDRGEGVWALRLDGSDRVHAAPALQAWQSAVARLPQGGNDAPRVLLLEGLERLEAAGEAQAMQGWRSALAASPQPVVAVLQPAASVVGLEVAEHCTLRCAPGDDALALAHTIARGSALALAGLQAQFARPLPALGAMTDVNLPAAVSVPLEVVRRWPVLTLERAGEAVALVRMHDREARNCSSPALVAALEEVFAAIATMPAFRVVVLTGFDTYFACGGTREGLLAIQGGASRFTDEQTYALPLHCELPVIAAMQGHAIGAGWALGLFCDAALYAAEGMYQSPYMLYGFTPGAGSTCIFPLQLGRHLGREVLLTAREYRGRELQSRGLGAPVLPRAEVLPRALALAQRWAATPRAQLVADKTSRVAALRAHLPTVFAQELALHQHNFLANPDVVARIDRHFKAALPAATAASTTTATVDAAELVERLRASLAEELALPLDEVRPDQAFIDLGIDSISAVTWVRRLNREFGLELPATLVYRHPTLAQLATALAGQVTVTAPVTIAPPVAAPRDTIGTQLRDSLAAELLLAPEELDDERSFLELGLDSVNAVTWVRAINARFGLDVPATVVYRHTTLGQLRQHLQ
ncbi:MAG TPA: beta-ketoacyl synthase N-terminal-like domain-containing protein, partial [Ramlibacter sp.]